MNIKCSLTQCPSLKQLNYRNVELTFKSPINQLGQSISMIMADIYDKPLVKYYLIPEQLPEPKYESVVLGGTFDYLHIGHQLLVLMAVLLAKVRIVIGLTGESMLVNKKNKQVIQHYEIRKLEVLNYIRKIKPNLIVDIVQLNDMYGPAITLTDIDAIIVSEQTLQGGKKVNQKRVECKLKPLIIEVCPLANINKKMEGKLSSSVVREYILKKNQVNGKEFQWYKNKWRGFNKELYHHLNIDYNQGYVEIWWNRILLQYSEYWRYYHTNKHIFDILHEWQNHPQKPKLTSTQALSIESAIWFHDIQYIPISKTNEQDSAKIFIQFISGLSNQKNHQQLEKIRELTKQSILDTKLHRTQEQWTKILIDLDMGILNSEIKRYKQYMENIRNEYKQIPKNVYNKKRIQFLKSLLIDKVFYFIQPNNLQHNIRYQISVLELNNQEEL